MSETERRSSERFNRRNRLATAKKRPRQFIQTPRGHALTADFLTYLADFLAGKLTEQPLDPPRFLREPVQQLADPRFLALAALAALLDTISRGWDRDDPSADAKLKLKVGDDLYQRLRKDPKVTLPSPWGAGQRVQAGDWLLRQALALDIFAYDDDGFPRISDKWLPDVAQLRERMIAADPAYAPLLKPPPPWTGWEKSYDGFPATFVRDWRPETKTAIDVAFLNPLWDHARGVNALAGVPLKIDPVMLDLVERFAVDLMGNDGTMRKADQVTVAADVADAKWCGERAIWNDYSCDRRGRIYALQHLNFARADHIRSLFRFANGMKLDAGDTYWLEIHCANCEGSTDKKSRAERIKWVGEHRQDIMDIAKDPFGTFDKWRGADSPFAFVAACRELAAAWNDPENFETHLPIGFDGSANGLQHLALLSGDLVTAAMVNLFVCR